MKNVKRVLAMLLAVLMSFQPLGTINALDTEGETSTNLEVVTAISDFEVDEVILSQETTVASDYAPVLPESITAIFSELDEEGNIDESQEPTSKDVAVTWTEKEGKTFSTETAAIYTYHATLVKQEEDVQNGVELPVVIITVKGVDSDVETLVEKPNETSSQAPKQTRLTSMNSTAGSKEKSDDEKLRFVTSSLPYAPVGVSDYKWDYTSHTIEAGFNYTVAFVADDTPGAPNERVIEIDVDPYNNGVASPWVIDTASMNSDFIISSKSYIASDKLSIVYVIDNSKISGAEGATSFTLKRSAYFGSGSTGEATTYLYPNGTLASNIGVMLHANPNGDLGVKMQEHVAGTNPLALTAESVKAGSQAFLKHTIKRDNHAVSPLYVNQGMYNASSTKIENTLHDMYLGSDGYLYFRNEDGTMIVSNIADRPNTVIPVPVNQYRYILSDDDKAPIKDLSLSFTVPHFFNGGGSYVVETLEDNVESSNGLIGTLSNNNNTQMLTGVKPAASTQYIALNATGTSISANQALHKYVDTSYIGEPINTTYQQVVPATGGVYTVETYGDGIDLSNIQINKPDYDYQDLMTMRVSIPEKVNSDDLPDQKYYFTMYNNVDSYIGEGEKIYTNKYIKDNIAPYFHNDGTMKYIFNDDNFAPKTLTLPNQYNEYTEYQIVYENGEKSTPQAVSGQFTVDTSPNASGSKVKEVIVNISENGLVKTGAASGYEFNGYFTGTFTEPEGDSKVIKVDVEFDSDKNQDQDREKAIDPAQPVKKELTWEFKAAEDYLHLSFSMDEGQTTVNGDTGNDSIYVVPQIQIPYSMKAPSIVYKDVRITLFDTSDSVVTDDGDPLTEDEIAQSKALLAQLVAKGTFVAGNPLVQYVSNDMPDARVWIEYTTNKNADIQTMELSSTENKAFDANLGQGEYLTSYVICADRLRLSGADKVDRTHKGQQFDSYLLFSEYMDFKKERYEDVPIFPDIQIRPYATISASNISDTWTPPEGVTEIPENSKKTTSNNYSYYNNWVEIIYNELGSVLKGEQDHVYPTSVGTGDTFNKDVVIELSAYLNPPAYAREVFTFAPGTKVYLQLNDQQFRYIGNNEKIEAKVIDGKTWLIYDLSTLPRTTKTITIPQAQLMPTALVNTSDRYRLFLDGYMDIAPTLDIVNTDVPYISYNADSNLNSIRFDNPHDLKSLAPESTQENRFVQFELNQTVQINVARKTTVDLYPGIEGVGDFKQTLAYNIHEYDDLTLTFEVGSSETLYRDYHIIIELPRTNVPQEVEGSTPVTSKHSLYLRSLDGSSVEISENLLASNPVVRYASAASFNQAVPGSVVNVTETTDLKEADYLVVTFPALPKSTFGTIKLKLEADHSALFESPNFTEAYATLNARFEYTTSDEETPIYTVGEARSAGPAKYTFEYVRLEGSVFEDNSTLIPDGIYQSASDSKYSTANIKLKNLNAKTPEEQVLKVENSGKGFLVYLKPALPDEQGNAPYNIVLDLEGMNISTTHTLSTNTSSNPDHINNNNGPRTRDSGIMVYTDTIGYTNVRPATGPDTIAVGDEPIVYASDYELANGFVNFAVHRNPTLTIEPNEVRVREEENMTFDMNISGVGTLKDGFEYVVADGTEFGTFAKHVAGDKESATITFAGVKDTGVDVVKDATTTLVNYFGEEIVVENRYSVYPMPKVTFHVNEFNKPDSKGTWQDASTDPSKTLNLLSPAEVWNEGTIAIANVPILEAPLNQVFDRWQLADGTPIEFSDITLLANGTELYPRFIKDELIDIDEDDDPTIPGDGIQDIYQTTVHHVVKNGTFEVLEGTPPTNTSEVVTFKHNDVASENPNAEAEFEVQVPVANPGYGGGEWIPSIPNGILDYTPLEVTYTYEFVPNKYLVNFDKNDINATGNTPEQEFTYDVEQPLNPNGFENIGKVFIGWSTDPNAITPSHSDSEVVKNLTTTTDPVTLYAVWGLDENKDGIHDIYQTTVTYKIENGTWDGKGDNKDIEEWITFVDKDGNPSDATDAIATIKKTPTQMFVDETFDQETGRWVVVPPKQVIFTKEKLTYVYTFTNNAIVTYPGVSPESSGKLPTDSFEIVPGTSITVDNQDGMPPQTIVVDKDINLPEPTKEGNIFTGYEYNPETNTLTATWKNIIFTVIFEENGGSNVPNQKGTVGQSIEIPVNPTKSGYTFEAWYLDKELTQRFDFATMVMPEGDLVLYAKWRANTQGTGDNTQVVLWTGLMATAALGFIVLRKTRKTKVK